MNYTSTTIAALASSTRGYLAADYTLYDQSHRRGMPTSTKKPLVLKPLVLKTYSILEKEVLAIFD